MEQETTIRKFRIVQTEGLRQVSREVVHYNLQMIIAVGFKVNNERAVQFRKWANGIVKDYTIKGWVMDDERLKNGGSVLTTEYFDRLLEQIREIRLSERRFYQKITDIYATSLDYDRTAQTTKQFFAKVQNKMHYAVHGHTVAELIYERADAEKPHMGLTTWAAAPEGKIVKSDISIAKNYLTEKEMRSLERIVSAYLDLAEDRAERHIPTGYCKDIQSGRNGAGKAGKRKPEEMPHISAHILRHTACTRMAETDLDIKVVQYVMGHANISVTMDVYNHVMDQERIVREIAKLDEVQVM